MWVEIPNEVVIEFVRVVGKTTKKARDEMLRQCNVKSKEFGESQDVIGYMYDVLVKQIREYILAETVLEWYKVGDYYVRSRRAAMWLSQLLDKPIEARPDELLEDELQWVVYVGDV